MLSIKIMAWQVATWLAMSPSGDGQLSQSANYRSSGVFTESAQQRGQQIPMPSAFFHAKGGLPSMDLHATPTCHHKSQPSLLLSCLWCLNSALAGNNHTHQRERRRCAASRCWFGVTDARICTMIPRKLVNSIYVRYTFVKTKNKYN